MRRLVTALGLVAMGAIVATVVALFISHRAAERSVRQESHSVVEAVRRVVRLSTVEMAIANYQFRTDSKELLGFLPIRCEKTAAAFYRGKVQAGFDLEDGLGVETDVVARRILVRLPPPIIIATDLRPPDVIETSGSVCNKLTAEDYRLLHDRARKAIQKDAIAAGILTRAEKNLRDVIPELAASFGWQIEFQSAGTGGSPRKPAPRRER